MSLMILLIASCTSLPSGKSDICKPDFVAGIAHCRNSVKKKFDEMSDYFLIHKDTLSRLMTNERD